MRPIAPRIEGCDEDYIAMGQPGVLQITAATLEASDPRAIDGRATRVCRWTFSHAERKAVADGADIYFLTPAAILLTPHCLTVKL